MLRKYIAYARKNVNPVLSDEANEVLKNFYVDTRNSSSNTEENSAVPITARQLEAIIRLAEACAKIKLKEVVEREDAKKAVRLQMASLKDAGVDPETGEIEADIVSGGRPKSERDKMSTLVDEIKLIEEEYNGQAPLTVLKSNMEEKHGVSEDKVENLIRNMTQRGILYEPSPGNVKRV